ncbi:MAG TPA: hypothetical protein VII12_12510, partial [Thermoanaerobaculia bacterium]
MRRAVKAMLAAGSAAAAAAAAAERRLVAAPRYRGPVTDHFDGERFFNPNYVRQREGAAFLKWMLHRE